MQATQVSFSGVERLSSTVARIVQNATVGCSRVCDEENNRALQVLFTCILAKRLAYRVKVHADERGVAAATSHRTGNHGLPCFQAIPGGVWGPVERVELPVGRVKPPRSEMGRGVGNDFSENFDPVFLRFSVEKEKLHTARPPQSDLCPLAVRVA